MVFGHLVETLMQVEQIFKELLGEQTIILQVLQVVITLLMLHNLILNLITEQVGQKLMS